MPTCFWILVVSSPTCLWWKRGPGGHFLGQVPQRSGQLSIGKLTCQTIHGEHQSPAQWPHTRIFPGKTKLVLQPRSSVQTYNQEPNNIQQTYTEPTFSRSPKPTNDKRLTNQNMGVVVTVPENLVHWRPQNQGPKTQSTGGAIHGETGFARVFGHQNEGHKFRRKRNSSLDTSMAKPTPEHLLRMVEREGKCGAPRLKKRRDYNVKVAFRGFLLVFVFPWKFLTPIQLKLCKTQTGCRYRAL